MRHPKKSFNLGIAVSLYLGLCISAPSQAFAESYFDWLSSLPETMVFRAYDSQAEIDADINAVDPANRVNPPVHDSAMNAARWAVGGANISNRDQLRPTFPVVSSGNLLLVWEARWDRAWSGGDLGELTTHKAFQLSKLGSGDERRIEIRTRFPRASGNEVAGLDARGYVWNPSGSPLPGQITDFKIVADTWTRFWAYLDFDRGEFSLWVSDDSRAPVALFSSLKYSDMNRGLDNFWFEFGSSQKSRTGPSPAYLWARNFTALRDVSDISQIVSQGVALRPNPPTIFAAQD